jgi:UTP--glucose-1-phosphate uridylyltransferase
MNTQSIVHKAVIPAAGRGTRFLPATKAQPKEMLPIIDKPTIQYVVEEAVAAGIDDILIITSREKRAVEDHFDRDGSLENMLDHQSTAWRDYLPLRRLSERANLHYIRQREPRGLGDAIYHARHHVGAEPFAVLLGDSIVTAEKPCIAQLIDIYTQYGAPVIGLEEVPRETVHRYGIVGGNPLADRVYEVNALVEKPSPQEAPSCLAIGARYILTPDVFDEIAVTEPGKGGEIQLTDALERLRESRRILGYHFLGHRHDIGNKLDFLKTTVEFAARREDLGADFRDFLRRFVSDLGTP